MNKCYNNCDCEEVNPALETVCDDVNNYNYDYEMHNNHHKCNCGFEEETSLFPENPMLGQSYVPIQYMDKTFMPEVGLKMGTIFPELVSPYCPGQSMKEISYLEATNKIGEGCNTCRKKIET